MAFTDTDNFYVKAVRILHSNNPDSLINIRSLLDEAIKSKYGPGKELEPHINFSNVFRENLPASASTSFAGATGDSLKDDLKECDSSQSDLELDLLKEDLLCVVCKGMGVGARNRLVECCECHDLYHQECHDPTVTDQELEIEGWLCISCQDILARTKKSAQSPSNISSKTNQLISSKSYDKEFCDIGMSSTKSMGSKSSSSSSSSSSSKSSGSSSRVVTPNINLVSADKRLQIMKKKAAKMQEKRKLSR